MVCFYSGFKGIWSKGPKAKIKFSKLFLKNGLTLFKKVDQKEI